MNGKVNTSIVQPPPRGGTIAHQALVSGSSLATGGLYRCVEYPEYHVLVVPLRSHIVKQFGLHYTLQLVHPSGLIEPFFSHLWTTPESTWTLVCDHPQLIIDASSGVSS